MAEAKYRLVFQGEVAQGRDVASVKENLGALLKVDAGKVEQIFRARRVTIKTNLDHGTALKYKSAFDATGAMCFVEPVADPAQESREAPRAAAPVPVVAPRRLDVALPPEFSAVRDRDEEIFWTGRPNFTAFVIRGIPFLLLGLIWGSFDYFGFIRNSNIPLGFGIPFFALHLFPLWGSILNMVRLFLVHGNTCYAFSNKRLMMRSGFWGTDFKAIDYDKISDIEVNVNPVENWLGVGTIQAFSGRVGNKGGASTTGSSGSKTRTRYSRR